MSGIKVQNLVYFVLILGLVACSPDKPTKQEDKWRFSPPEIVLPDAGDGTARGRMKVGEVSQKDLPLDAELHFTKITSDLVFEIDSNCSHAGQNFEETFKLLAPQALELGSIVPARALLEVKENVIECSFSFTAVNEHKSRHRFLIPGVKLIGGTEYGKLVVSEKLRRISPSTPAEEKAVVQVNDLDQLAVDSKITTGVAELACADFVSRENFRSVDTINWKQLAYKQPIDVLENVLRKFRQPCRLALKDDRGVRLELSALFILRYPAPEIEITSSTPTFNSYDISEMPVLNMKIVNKASVDQYLGFPEASAEAKVVWCLSKFGGRRDEQAYYYSPGSVPGNSGINFSIAGSEKVVSAPGRKIVLVKAKSEITVAVMAHNRFKNSSSVNSAHGGFVFFFSNPLKIQQLEISGDLEAKDEANVQLAGEIPIFKTLPHHFSETQVYVPHANVTADWSFIVRNLQPKAFPTMGD